MKVSAMAWLLVAVGAAMLPGCRGQERSTAAAAQRGTPLPILGGLSGNDPAFSEPGLQLIRSQEQLDALNNEQLRNLGPDFNSEAILVLSLGEQPTGGYWARVLRVERRGQDLVVHGLANQPGPEEAVTQALTYPFDAVLIPAVPENVMLSSEGVESVVGQEHPDALAGGGMEGPRVGDGRGTGGVTGSIPGEEGTPGGASAAPGQVQPEPRLPDVREEAGGGRATPGAGGGANAGGTGAGTATRGTAAGTAAPATQPAPAGDRTAPEPALNDEEPDFNLLQEEPAK